MYMHLVILPTFTCLACLSTIQGLWWKYSIIDHRMRLLIWARAFFLISYKVKPFFLIDHCDSGLLEVPCVHVSCLDIMGSSKGKSSLVLPHSFFCYTLLLSSHLLPSYWFIGSLISLECSKPYYFRICFFWCGDVDEGSRHCSSLFIPTSYHYLKYIQDPSGAIHFHYLTSSVIGKDTDLCKAGNVCLQGSFTRPFFDEEWNII